MAPVGSVAVASRAVRRVLAGDDGPPSSVTLASVASTSSTAKYTDQWAGTPSGRKAERP